MAKQKKVEKTSPKGSDRTTYRVKALKDGFDGVLRRKKGEVFSFTTRADTTLENSSWLRVIDEHDDFDDEEANEETPEESNDTDDVL